MSSSQFSLREWGPVEGVTTLMTGRGYPGMQVTQLPFSRLKRFDLRSLSIGDEIAMIPYYHPPYDRRLHEGLFVSRILESGQPVLRNAYTDSYVLSVGSAPHMSRERDGVEYARYWIVQGWDLCIQLLADREGELDVSSLCLGARGIQQVWVNGVQVM